MGGGEAEVLDADGVQVTDLYLYRIKVEMSPPHTTSRDATCQQTLLCPRGFDRIVRDIKASMGENAHREPLQTWSMQTPTRMEDVL